MLYQSRSPIFEESTVGGLDAMMLDYHYSLSSWCCNCDVMLTYFSHPCFRYDIKLNNAILAEEKHLPM
jgi:hypothetical protein